MALEDLEEEVEGGQDDDEQEEVVDTTGEVVEIEDDEVEPAEPENSLVRPVDDIEGVVEMYEQFDEIKSKLLDNNEDVVDISGNPHVTKSGWRKIATAFNLSVSTVNKRTWVEEGVIHVEVTAKAVAPNGKASSGTGVASSNESNFTIKVADLDADEERVKELATDPGRVVRQDRAWREVKRPNEVNRHNLVALAETRAKNRAISDCVGGGEVSAEEMGADLL